MRFASKNTQSHRIAQTCSAALKEVGLHVGGNVFELRNSKGDSGWLVSLLVPAKFQVPPVEALALRLFLAKRIEAALGMIPKSLRLELNFSSEAKRLPFAESIIEPKWLKSRMALCLGKPGRGASPAGNKAAPVTSLRIVPPPNASVPNGKPVSESAKIQEAKLKSLLESLDDDDLYEVNEGSMSDFDRAVQ
jgi:hypothetical protein